MNDEKANGRRDYVKKLSGDFNADAVIYEAMKSYEFQGHECALSSHILTTKMDFPFRTIKRNHT